MKRISILAIPLVLMMPYLSKGQDTAIQKIYGTPYYGYFKEYKNRDSVVSSKIASLGNLLSSNEDLSVISFRWTATGACCGGTVCMKKTKGDSLSKEDVEFLSKLTGGTLFFDDILVTNKVGRIYSITPFYLFVKE